MASYCRDVFLCMVVVVVCFTLQQARVNSMEMSSTDIMNITISNKESETKKHFDIENATRADMSELSRRNDDTDIDETEEKPKTKQDPYTKKLLETLNRMRENPQGFNIKEFLEAVNKTNELRKSATTTSTPKPEKINKNHDDDDTDEGKTSTTTEVTDDEHDHEGTDEEKSSTTTETTDDEHHHEDTDEEKTSTTTEMTDDEHDHDGTDEEKSSTTTEITDDDDHHEGTDEEKTSTTTEVTDDDGHHEGTDEGTTSTTTTIKPNTKGEYDYGGNGSSNCTCKTSLGVCYPIGARQCLFNNGAKVVRCDISGKWTFFKECPKSCEWKGGNIAECIN